MRRPAPMLLRAILALVAWPGLVNAQATVDLPAGNPFATVDLRTTEGAALVQARWRYSDVEVIETVHHAVGPGLRASGPANRTNDISPHAEALDFDDSAWETIEPAALEVRRSNGRLAFNWYRTRLTLPRTLGGVDLTGATVVFELVVDDYAEIWVDGRLPLVLGQTGGQLIKGFNSPNRVVLTRDARPGQQFQLAVFGVNGPVSRPPENFIWIRSATLDIHHPGQIGAPAATRAKVVRLDPALDRILPKGTVIEKLAGGFQFVEGPVWHPDGYLLFSDPNANTIYRWTPDGAVSVFRSHSGYAGIDVGEYRQPGSNGLTLDRKGRLTINEHGNRRVTRLELTGAITVLADRYEGKRLNSPNDLVYRSDGTLYFTDPPFGLPKVFDDPRRELPFSGVYRVKNGQVTLLTKELSGPNGIAISPDERHLYVGNWDLKRKVLMRYELQANGTIAGGTVFYDFTRIPEPVALDGIKVDEQGNVYVSAPGGVWILSPAGRPLGRIVPPEHDANFTFGDADGRSLYLTASTGLYRVRLNIPGVRPGALQQAAAR
ncbi:MAG TPA: SMP-30/gluconolactonase/LRE family protein [Gemmatimonadales bacterium]|nr:SMP-30/gluconolactonase/LRE family protein [Gemmatimonadales bacterium]